MISCRESENRGAAEVKGFGGLGAVEALTGDRETDCTDDSWLWRTGAAAAPRCKLRGSEGGSAEWHEDRTESVRGPRALRRRYWSADDLSAHTHVRTHTRSDSGTAQSNMSEYRGTLGNQLYFSEPEKVAFRLVNYRRFNSINSGRHPGSFLLTWHPPPPPCLYYD